jgi:hypothetical protein
MYIYYIYIYIYGRKEGRKEGKDGWQFDEKKEGRTT